MRTPRASQRRGKIVATLGPASAAYEDVRRLVEAGINVARINGSHGDHERHAQSIAFVRRASEEVGRPVGVLFDLQGPKIRVGNIEGPPLAVEAGDLLVFAVGRAPKERELPSDYDLLDRDASEGDPLLIDDGRIATRVESVEPGTVRCRVENSGTISARKGINLPNNALSAPAITQKDEADALFAAAQGADAIALSFVRRADDVRDLQRLLHDAGHDVPLIAKIEKPQALEHLDEILTASWGVMIARGDLGVELSPEYGPTVQKEIIRRAKAMGRPVITATQMLESMTSSPRPTRAEASDVANAVLDGTDAVMLSAETAIGRYPIEAVSMMARIIETTERGRESAGPGRRRERGVRGQAEAVADACSMTAHNIEADALVAFTSSGRTAVLMSQLRPETPILAFTPNPRVLNRLTFVWGVRARMIAHSDSVGERVRHLDEALLRNDLARVGDKLVIAMGEPTSPPGSTNLMMLHRVGDAATEWPEPTA
jgi:pyruvate kinase